ncbi:diflavin oxidoreductase [Segetibacter aerophilus]|uniref:assimilatory sulfite reductase (NADPH) n=1 Tax=Segetibacter aerophilus TaxID=670293 RepID=A0A512BEN8_9BACT|nr:flavodoxin domain-containing protein [Segetibacter aerophilus]GEO10436.1 sulfite reductase [NADPH] flavoprotein alpha-component [Segetibacter aerophilus]
MLQESKLKTFLDFVGTLTRDEKIWVNGYLSGLISDGQSQPEVSAAVKPVTSKITITYGTETGNSKRLASDFAAKAKKSGINAKVISLDQYRLNDIAKENYFLAIVSTHGEGEPPAAAKKFYDYIHENTLELNKLKYGVLALGDTSYPLFATAGEEVDSRLNKLGGERLVPLQKCDVDYESDAEGWFMQVMHQLTKSSNGSVNGNGSVSVTAPAVAKKSTGKKIYTGTILTNINLNDRGSNKETHHIEIAADDIEYLPGDSLGVIPENPLRIVEPIVELLNIDREKTFSFRSEEVTAFELLRKKLNIFYLPERVVSKYAALVGQDIPSTKIALLDLLKIYPLKDNSQFDELIEILEPIAPRLYSISSSPEAHSGEVHVTVARDKFHVNDEWKCGLCSDYLSQLTVDSSIEFYIHKNSQFRLPEDDKDIIMIGPGTGIAPFRSFLAHRDATGATGRNWLFFGDQHFVTDFLYQTELQNWKDSGTLTKINLAFSRDQKEKIYVQHKMLQNGAEFYDWISNGASIYVCGAKEPMSADVEDTLMQIVEKFGNKTIEEAVQFVEQLKEDGRYLKDVY